NRSSAIAAKCLGIVAPDWAVSNRFDFMLARMIANGIESIGFRLTASVRLPLQSDRHIQSVSFQPSQNVVFGDMPPLSRNGTRLALGIALKCESSLFSFI